MIVDSILYQHIWVATYDMKKAGVDEKLVQNKISEICQEDEYFWSLRELIDLNCEKNIEIILKSNLNKNLEHLKNNLKICKSCKHT